MLTKKEIIAKLSTKVVNCQSMMEELDKVFTILRAADLTWCNNLPYDHQSALDAYKKYEDKVCIDISSGQYADTKYFRDHHSNTTAIINVEKFLELIISPNRTFKINLKLNKYKNNLSSVNPTNNDRNTKNMESIL